MRMGPCTYQVSTYLDVSGQAPDRSGLAVLVDPETVLDQDREVVLDAREARLLQTEAPQVTEDRQRKVDFQLIDSTGMEVRSAYPVAPTTDDVYVLPTEPVTEGSFILTTRWRKGEPLLGLTTANGKVRFETIVQPGRTLTTASRTVPSVYACTGATGDYSGMNARGKIVVVDRSDEVGPEERATAAADAGARALIVVNDGAGGLMESVGESPIPVATVHRTAGRRLVAQAKAGRTLALTQDPYTDYVYDLTRDYPDYVPDHELVYTPTRRQLARIDARYYGVKAGEAAGYRGDLTLTPTLGSQEREWHPGTRVEWVTPKQVWVESHAQNMVRCRGRWCPGPTRSRRGRRPGSTGSGRRPARVQRRVRGAAVAGTGLHDLERPVVELVQQRVRPGRLPALGRDSTHTQVFQGDTLIHDNPYSSDMQWEEVPAGDLPYRVVHDASRPASVFRLSTSTHTEWTFRSDTEDSDYFEDFSVLQLDYDLETNLRGDIKGGKPHEIAIRSVPSHDGTPVPGKVTQVTLAVSYDDGHTWRKIALTRTHGWWRGSLRAPAKRGFVSVRASAQTGGGYGIEQEIIRAYGLR